MLHMAIEETKTAVGMGQSICAAQHLDDRPFQHLWRYFAPEPLPIAATAYELAVFHDDFAA